jgi:hypothetical protein
LLRREGAKEATQDLDNLADQVVPLRLGPIARINREHLSISVFKPLLIALILSAFHFFILGATAIFVVTLSPPEPSHPLLAPKITIFLTPLVPIIRDKRQGTAATFFDGKFMFLRILLEELQVRKQYLFGKDQLEMGTVLRVNKKTNQKNRFN